MSQTDRAARKSDQIIAGARSAFLKLGYEGTSVDDIAKRANVSKPTVYKHFTDKKSLFVAFVRLECASHADAVFRVDLQDRDIRKCLRSIARQYLELILSPFAQSIFRLAAAETKRFPEIGRVFYDSAIATGSRRLSQLLSGAVARGDFMIDDVDLAAHQFLELCKADIFYRTLFGVDPEFDDADKDRQADIAVAAFFKIYGNDHNPR